MVATTVSRIDESKEFASLRTIEEPERATYSLKEFGKCLGVSYSKMHLLAQQGALPVTPLRVGRAYLFRKSDVNRLLGIGE
jgi:excisionase family DNA binding protein